jgi:hypothetical protein
MKKLYVIISLSALFLSFISAKSQNLDDKWLAEGTVMKYMVNNDYDFTITIVNLQNGVEFDWTMRDGKRKGIVKMTSEALKNATTQNNHFSPSDEAYYDYTTVWVSSKVYRSLKSATPITIKPEMTDESLVYKKTEKMNILVDGVEKQIDVLYAETDKGSKFWIWDNPKAPIIMHMILSFEIIISDVKTKK